MKRSKWFDRKFDFSSAANIFPSLLERLGGTPVRLEEKLKEISTGFVSRSVDNTWSIKENIGHLTDLEPLWQGRLQDIIQGKPEMRTTDLLNQQTDLANHNDQPTGKLLIRFREVRMQTMRLIEDLDEETIFKSALHPRLKVPMRTMDLFLFVAEHDDHHLARITEIAKHCMREEHREK